MSIRQPEVPENNNNQIDCNGGRRSSNNSDTTDVESEWTVSGTRQKKPTSRFPCEAHQMLTRLVLKTVIREDEDDEHESFYFILKKAIEQEALVSHDGDLEDDRQLSREELLQKLRKKKAVIEKLRRQPWPMRRKRRTLLLAQKYSQQHEAKVSKFHLIREEFKRKFKKFKRWLINLSIYLIPWEAKIKTIESHFGSVVSSYFTFLRWLVWVNMIMTLFMLTFIVIPECIADAFPDEERRNHSDTADRKEIDHEEWEYADYLQTIWDYKGYLSVSPLFYGYYSNKEYILAKFKYKLPLAYFLVNIFTLGYSFFAILRKMASNMRLSKLTGSKTEQYPFAWKIFTGWDYSIGNPEAAANTFMANANKLREAIVEHKTKQKQNIGWIRVIMRIFANVIIACMIAGSAYAIYAVVERSKLNINPSVIEQNQVAIVVSFITQIFPNFFELISRALEGFHPRISLRVHLGRILTLYLLNFYTLIIALLTKINELRAEQDALLNATLSPPLQPAATEMEATVVLGSTEIAPGLDTRRFIRFAPFYQGVEMVNGPALVHNSLFLASLAAIAFNLTSQFSGHEKSIIGSATLPYPIPAPISFLSIHRINQFGSDTASHGFPFIPQRRRRHSRTQQEEQFSPATVSSLTSEVVYLDNVDSVTVVETPRPERITASPITQRERRLQRLCWETWVGQEIAKLITMDLVMTVVSVVTVDFSRGLWVRYCHRWWCWNLETTFPEYGEFKVAENVLHIINNQGMIWLGLFFSPLLPAMNNLKLVILMYVRGWAVMTCNVPATQVFRASRSSNFYFMLLLLMLFLCTLPVGFLIASYRPSTTCGPFSSLDRFYYIVTNRLESQVPPEIYKHVNMITSPGIIIPVFLMLSLVIYFLISLVRGLRESNQDLQKQLIHERTEEKRKIYRLAGGGKKNHLDHLRRLSVDLPEMKKVDTSFLPKAEQMRREAWRMRITLDDESSGGCKTPPDSPGKTKRSIRQMLTPVREAAKLDVDLATLYHMQGKPADVTFDTLDEEEDQQNLMARWILHNRQMKAPPLASLDDDNLLKRSPATSPIFEVGLTFGDSESGNDANFLLSSLSPPPAYNSVWKNVSAESSPNPALLEEGRFITAAREKTAKSPVHKKNAEKKQLVPSSSSPLFSPRRKHFTGSNRSGESSRWAGRKCSQSGPPSVMLATSRRRSYHRFPVTSAPNPYSAHNRELIDRADNPDTKLNKSLLTSTASCHLRSNIEDEDDDITESHQLLRPYSQKPSPPHRKFHKSVSTAFFPWSPTPSPAQSLKQRPRARPIVQSGRKASLPSAPRTGQHASQKVTISVRSPGEHEHGPEAEGKGYVASIPPSVSTEQTSRRGVYVTKTGQSKLLPIASPRANNDNYERTISFPGRSPISSTLHESLKQQSTRSTIAPIANSSAGGMCTMRQHHTAQMRSPSRLPRSIAMANVGQAQLMPSRSPVKRQGGSQGSKIASRQNLKSPRKQSISSCKL